jgi:hypothetical protein
MDALAALKQLKDLQATQCSPSGLPDCSPLPWPTGQEESIERKPQQEEVVNEITAWWQKALGTKAVLGQASNRTSPGQRSPIPKLLWTKPESGEAQQEITVVEATPIAIEKKGASNPETQERKQRVWMGRRLTALGRFKHWSGVMLTSWCSSSPCGPEVRRRRFVTVMRPGLSDSDVQAFGSAVRQELAATIHYRENTNEKSHASSGLTSSAKSGADLRCMSALRCRGQAAVTRVNRKIWLDLRRGRPASS